MSAWSGGGDEQTEQEGEAPGTETHALWWSGVDDDASRQRNPAITRARPTEPADGPVGPPGMAPSTWTGPAYSAAVRPIDVATRPGRALYVWAFFTILGGAAVIVGSATTWVRLIAFGHTYHFAGTAASHSTVFRSSSNLRGSTTITVTTNHFHASHGWITLALGGGIVLFAALLMLVRPTILRLLPLLASLGALGYGIYQMVDIQTNITSLRHSRTSGLFAALFGNVNAHIGYGLIVVVAGASVAVVASLGAARTP